MEVDVNAETVVVIGEDGTNSGSRRTSSSSSRRSNEVGSKTHERGEVSRLGEDVGELVEGVDIGKTNYLRLCKMS